MKIDEKTVHALKSAIDAVDAGDISPIPIDLLKPLMAVARPGQHMRLDFEASSRIGAPLIMVSNTGDLDSLLSPLTNRQREVALLIIDGFSNRAIAHQLGISVATVKDHVHAVLERLEFASRTALVSAARYKEG